MKKTLIFCCTALLTILTAVSCNNPTTPNVKENTEIRKQEAENKGPGNQDSGNQGTENKERGNPDTGNQENNNQQTVNAKELEFENLLQQKEWKTEYESFDRFSYWTTYYDQTMQITDPEKNKIRITSYKCVYYHVSGHGEPTRSDVETTYSVSDDGIVTLEYSNGPILGSVTSTPDKSKRTFLITEYKIENAKLITKTKHNTSTYNEEWM